MIHDYFRHKAHVQGYTLSHSQLRVIDCMAQHASALGLANLLQGMQKTQEQAYIDLQRQEWAAGQDVPTKSHHFFSGVPYHQLVGESLGGSRLGSKFQEKLAEERVV